MFNILMQEFDFHVVSMRLYALSKTYEKQRTSSYNNVCTYKHIYIYITFLFT